MASKFFKDDEKRARLEDADLTADSFKGHAREPCTTIVIALRHPIRFVLLAHDRSTRAGAGT
jgi:hypothetical protein